MALHWLLRCISCCDLQEALSTRGQTPEMKASARTAAGRRVAEILHWLAWHRVQPFLRNSRAVVVPKQLRRIFSHRQLEAWRAAVGGAAWDATEM